MVAGKPVVKKVAAYRPPGARGAGGSSLSDMMKRPDSGSKKIVNSRPGEFSSGVPGQGKQEPEKSSAQKRKERRAKAQAESEAAEAAAAVAAAAAAAAGPKPVGTSLCNDLPLLSDFSCAADMTPEEKAKKLKALNKKLKAINDLKAKVAAGTTPDSDQKTKLAGESAILEDIKLLSA